MAYSTLTDLKKLIPETSVIQLTDDENTGSVNQARVDAAIAQADAEIDSYCGRRYTVPFTTVPDIVNKWSADEAIYNLYSRRVEEMPPVRMERHKDVIRQMEGVAKGIISIGEQPEPPSPATGGAQVNVTSSDRIFSRETLGNF